MWFADGHCDSVVRCLEWGAPLVGVHNFSVKRSQLQLCALFARDRARYVALRTAFWHAVERERERIAQVCTFVGIKEQLRAGKHAALLSVEGGAGITSAEQVCELYADGIRVMGLAWDSNALATASRHRAEGIPDKGLTALGREVVAAGNECGMIFDVSHLSDNSFWQVLELAEKPPGATHSCFRALCDHPRNLTDEMARALTARNGVIGINLYPPFLQKRAERVTLSDVLAHIAYGVSLLGERAMGLGCDIDGTDGQYPMGLSEDTSIPDALIRALERGFPKAIVGRLVGGNWLSYFRSQLRG